MSEDQLLSPVRHPRIPAQRGALIDLSVTPPPAPRRPVTRGRLAALAVVVFLAGAGGYTALRPVLPSFAPVVPDPPSADVTPSPEFARPGVPPAAADPVRTKPASF
ncbi:hypothetical protein OWR29_29575 [Actinoplanes sp. Pm04-4]|uniref:Uncharacterized protein n=1 Tax=Paractinoplanes pyxinae TaxID=2997416 RepID=A0ABT4B8H1_9ACTN|nr:hypothetical protein [Actinoplanes pyxinae]MCY1142165.1 hypothetical protein [Actinoplanes pyxinae]